MAAHTLAQAASRDLDDFLAQAEQLLREAIAVAAHSGLYDLAGSASRVAAEITRLREGASHGQPPIAQKPSKTGTVSTSNVPRLGTPASPSRSERKATGRVTPRSQATDYRVRKGVLIRTGRSKNKKGTYEHKVPKAVYEDVLHAMSTLAREANGPCTVDQILQALNQAGSPAPTYQVYGIVSFLKSRQAILQEGRTGYLFTPDVEEVGHRAWAETEGLMAR